MKHARLALMDARPEMKNPRLELRSAPPEGETERASSRREEAPLPPLPERILWRPMTPDRVKSDHTYLPFSPKISELCRIIHKIQKIASKSDKFREIPRNSTAEKRAKGPFFDKTDSLVF